MSSLLVESPGTNSQLYFTWFEDLHDSSPAAHQEPSPSVRVTHRSANRSVPGDRSESGENQTNSSQKRRQPNERSEPASYQAAGNGSPQGSSPVTSSTSDAEAFTIDRLEFTWTDGTPRIAKPVKMGGVMIQLLKRYGITDEEIQEGMARYARKSVEHLAS